MPPRGARAPGRAASCAAACATRAPTVLRDKSKDAGRREALGKGVLGAVQLLGAAFGGGALVGYSEYAAKHRQAVDATEQAAADPGRKTLAVAPDNGSGRGRRKLLVPAL